MALKYQALNGTVISQTTTIQGPDISKAGSPMLSLSLQNGVNLYAMSDSTTGDYTITSASSTTASKFANYRNYGNYNAVATSSTGKCGLLYVNHNSSEVSIVGKATWILLTSSNEIVVVERNVDLAFATQDYILVSKPADNNYLISFTFTPTQ